MASTGQVNVATQQVNINKGYVGIQGFQVTIQLRAIHIVTRD